MKKTIIIIIIIVLVIGLAVGAYFLLKEDKPTGDTVVSSLDSTTQTTGSQVAGSGSATVGTGIGAGVPTVTGGPKVGQSAYAKASSTLVWNSNGTIRNNVAKDGWMGLVTSVAGPITYLSFTDFTTGKALTNSIK